MAHPVVLPESSLSTQDTATSINPPGLHALLTEIPRLDYPAWQSMGWFTRWLVMVRAPVLVMTLSATLTGALLALQESTIRPDLLLALVAGLVLAHATNNLVNDLVDHRQGVDRDNYFRRQYGTHVLEDGLVSLHGFLLVTGVTGIAALTCGVYLTIVTGPAAGYLTLIGAFFVLFYTWPLKHLALGELSVLLVWGPLIVAGSEFLLTGTISLEVINISLLAGVGPTLVILGKHIDKLSFDRAKEIRTLPVVLGDGRSRMLCLALLGLKWLAILVFIAAGAPWLILCLMCAPSLVNLVNVLRHPAPAQCPPGYPESAWPLWYSAAAFAYARNFGLLLIAGLLVSFAL